MALWLVQASWCPSLARADMIGINFYKTGAGQQMLDPSEEAGVEPQVHWNNVYWNGKSQLHNDSGLVTAVSVATTTSKDRDATWVPVGPSSSGDFRLMRQYIHSEGSGMTVIVSGLEPPFTTHGYDVIVYFDGENGSADWVTQYTIGVDGTTIATVYGRDAKDTVQWDGTFVQSFGATAAAATAGNYVRFTGLTASSFTLTATPISGDGPINAIQIVSVPEPTSLALLVLGAAAGLAARTRRSRFGR
ncbi:MAG: PEP-CTERM sorting domain-containing protein [Phycisphaerae bacterium]